MSCQVEDVAITVEAEEIQVKVEDLEVPETMTANAITMGNQDPVILRRRRNCSNHALQESTWQTLVIQ